MTDKPTVLFICKHNAGRSQLGAALLELAADDRYTATSAGSPPRRGEPVDRRDRRGTRPRHQGPHPTAGHARAAGSGRRRRADEARPEPSRDAPRTVLHGRSRTRTPGPPTTSAPCATPSPLASRTSSCTHDRRHPGLHSADDRRRLANCRGDLPGRHCHRQRDVRGGTADLGGIRRRASCPSIGSSPSMATRSSAGWRSLRPPPGRCTGRRRALPSTSPPQRAAAASDTCSSTH